MIKEVLKARSTVTNGTRGTLVIQPKAERVKSFNDEIQAELQSSSFADPNCGSWYKNKDGIITNNWSRTVVEYQKVRGHI